MFQTVCRCHVDHPTKDPGKLQSDLSISDVYVSIIFLELIFSGFYNGETRTSNLQGMRILSNSLVRRLKDAWQYSLFGTDI